MASDPSKSKSLLATVGALLLAGLAWVAQQAGWIDVGSEPAAGAGTSVASAPQATVQESVQPTEQPAEKPAEKPAAKPAAKPTAKPAAQPDDSVAGVAREDYELGLERIADGFENRLNDILVECAGEVVHILNDDDHPPRHQLFLVELENDITIKISHNIDQAPRVPVAKGDQVAFFGEYEWNDKGGVVHWTHLAHSGSHPDGWIRHKGRLYQ